MIKKVLSVVVALVVLLNVKGGFIVNAATVNEEKSIYEKPYIESVSVERNTNKLLKDIGDISVKEKLVIKGMKVPLYVTFDSQEEAIINIRSNKVVQEVGRIYNLDEISTDNWLEYYDAMFDYMESPICPDWLNEGNKDFRVLSNFFDIYENKEKNDEIISATSVFRKSKNALNIDYLMLLPYDSFNQVISNSKTEINKESLKTSVLGFDVNRGIAYATAHATSPNTTDYKKFSSDCTNFVSQILENGGVSQIKYNDENKGWWHVKKSGFFGDKHEHSISWIRADTFAKYMGVTYTTTSNVNFSNNIQVGDFIAKDTGNDGDWNHMGFVTDRHSYKTNGYYDYKVAQHTTNYHRWASSDDNAWDKIGADGGRYGRVRR
ncbi:Putative amidase domain-containing protein [Lachnospiraceae bacterium C10]|nr:Putative amidase domain-containing protein [Lachnospiraceae bacterium C10]SDX03597.1 Putative amidase domain-containing protein [Lachnospiraceae bacterium KHCPX20]